MSRENVIQSDVRLRLSELHAGIFLRYNVGTFLTLDGRPIKIGETHVSDLIGITPHVITQEDVGRTIGVFTALETKQVKDSTEKKRKEGQKNFLRRVNGLGGLGAIVRSVEDAESVVTEKWGSEKLVK